MNVDFDALYQRPDPFGYATRWYERRKRDLLAAMLPRPTFQRAWELGCSTGALTRLLAPRCGRILGTDVSPNAIHQAIAAGVPANVAFECSVQPRQWPTGRFDLIVFSEVGYYLDLDTLQMVARRMADSLDRDAAGGLVACHWRPDFDERLLPTDTVHRVLADALGGVATHSYADQDMRLEGWWPGPSIAAREGLA